MLDLLGISTEFKLPLEILLTVIGFFAFAEVFAFVCALIETNHAKT